MLVGDKKQHQCDQKQLEQSQLVAHNRLKFPSQWLVLHIFSFKNVDISRARDLNKHNTLTLL